VTRAGVVRWHGVDGAFFHEHGAGVVPSLDELALRTGRARACRRMKIRWWLRAAVALLPLATAVARSGRKPLLSAAAGLH